MSRTSTRGESNPDLWIQSTTQFQSPALGSSKSLYNTVPYVPCKRKSIYRSRNPDDPAGYCP
ncbi:hypothetical protein BDV38DRAFT_244587 [Aspergillus pseudotamarii]|uniref:Uncharacterized protein n=1 Tax=Aspergillus pseudotamarii TaxID=132259 RepID=A0A5N6SUV2_ASPPS|nr:uncharacterized protein BDV38DRAFT_244587 [Aspergillus pseudotamarii]KAE8138415.1 hypothetical protein BDV38DRAFT_244587 [Aspergillus pseudotamarii]